LVTLFKCHIIGNNEFDHIFEVSYKVPYNRYHGKVKCFF
jgi:hypothetical protein